MRISVSKLKAFKSCRRMYELKYVENVVPVQSAEALEVGKSYHGFLEELNKNGELPDAAESGFSKARAMAEAYKKYIYPNFHVVAAEEWLEYPLADGDVLVGIADALSDDGFIVEHKTTGSEITEQYEYNLLWDEQILAYMLMTGRRKVHYTVCRKPTIRQKKDESEEEFYKRMVAWYDEDTDSKIRLLRIERSDEDVEEFHGELLSMCNEIRHTGNFYRNTCHCNMWGRRCEYSSLCLHYDPNMEYVEFKRREEDGEQGTNSRGTDEQEIGSNW